MIFIYREEKKKFLSQINKNLKYAQISKVTKIIDGSKKFVSITWRAYKMISHFICNWLSHWNQNTIYTNWIESYSTNNNLVCKKPFLCYCQLHILKFYLFQSPTLIEYTHIGLLMRYYRKKLAIIIIIFTSPIRHILYAIVVFRCFLSSTTKTMHICVNGSS